MCTARLRPDGEAYDEPISDLAEDWPGLASRNTRVHEGSFCGPTVVGLEDHFTICFGSLQVCRVAWSRLIVLLG